MKNVLIAILTASASVALAADAPYLADHLTVWLRADKGLTTNAVGGVTVWANHGTLGAAVDVAPHADNSAGHVAYEASGIGGKPSLLFDGSVYLKTASAVNLGVTANGGAWFVVFRTPCDATERANMGIFGNDNNSARFGAFFPSGTDIYRSFFFGGEIGNRPFTASSTQIASAMCWKEGNTTHAYPMRNWEAGTVVNPSISPSSSTFVIGGMIPSAGWIKTFKGEIAEIRVYDKALTDRERSRVQFELCARYGVHWAAHGDIDNNALAWCETSAQLGRVTGYGVAEDLISSVSSGGATFTLGTSSAAEGARGYFANSGGNGLSCTWYVATHTSTRTGSDATFAFDRAEVRIGRNPALYYRQYMSDLWTKLDATATETDGAVSFTIPAGTWANGFYTAMGDLDSSLAMWHRADMGLETNAVGGVTSWANFGTSGAVLDMAPPSDNSAPHIAYAADGIGGQPSVSFDGDAYLQSAGTSGMGVTANGGAWFVVCRTSQAADERSNKAIFGGATGAGYRIGAFFPSGTASVRGYFWNNMQSTAGYPDVAVETDVPQILSTMAWTTNGTSKCYVMRGPVTGNASTSGSYTGAARISIGGNMLSWTPNFVGDIAEIRVYNRPLTGRERSEIQFELCARYGVSWTGHGGIDDTALAWCANGAQFGYWEADGLPEAVVTTATAGGATLTLNQTPAASAYTRGYLAHNGGDGLERIWYVSAAAAAKNLPMTLAIDASVVGGGTFALERSDSLDGTRTRAGAYTASANGQYVFSFGAGGWQGGFYHLRKQMAFMLVIR